MPRISEREAKEIKNPCLGCTERHLGCHSECEKHIAWKADEQRKKDIITDAKKRIQDVDEYVVRTSEKRKRRVRIK